MIQASSNSCLWPSQFSTEPSENLNLEKYISTFATSYPLLLVVSPETKESRHRRCLNLNFLVFWNLLSALDFDAVLVPLVVLSASLVSFLALVSQAIYGQKLSVVVLQMDEIEAKHLPVTLAGDVVCEAQKKALVIGEEEANSEAKLGTAEDGKPPSHSPRIPSSDANSGAEPALMVTSIAQNDGNCATERYRGDHQANEAMVVEKQTIFVEGNVNAANIASDDDSASDSDSSTSSSSSSSSSFLESVMRRRRGEEGGRSSAFSLEGEDDNDGLEIKRSLGDLEDGDLDGEMGGHIGPIRTKNEIDFVENMDLPLSLPPSSQIEILGSILHIVDDTVVIKATSQRKALDLDSLLAIDANTVLGRVFETFGPVDHPLYSVKFTTKAPATTQANKKKTKKNPLTSVSASLATSSATPNPISNALECKSAPTEAMDIALSTADVASSNPPSNDIVSTDVTPKNDIHVATELITEVLAEAAADAGLSSSLDEKFSQTTPDASLLKQELQINTKSAEESTTRMESKESEDERQEKEMMDSAEGKADSTTLIGEEGEKNAAQAEIEERKKREAEFYENRKKLLATLKVGMSVYFVVNDSKEVIDEKVWVKGYDASDVNDEELAPDDQEFSDDEAEKLHAAKMKEKRKKLREERMKSEGKAIDGKLNSEAPDASSDLLPPASKRQAPMSNTKAMKGRQKREGQRRMDPKMETTSHPSIAAALPTTTDYLHNPASQMHHHYSGHQPMPPSGYNMSPGQIPPPSGFYYPNYPQNMSMMYQQPAPAQNGTPGGLGAPYQSPSFPPYAHTPPAFSPQPNYMAPYNMWSYPSSTPEGQVTGMIPNFVPPPLPSSYMTPYGYPAPSTGPVSSDPTHARSLKVKQPRNAD